MEEAKVIESPSSRTSLRKAVLLHTGQDLRLCKGCSLCSIDGTADLDVTLDILVQMVLWNDEEVLTTRTLWSDDVFGEARYACRNGIDLQAVLLLLRQIAEQRGCMAP